MKAPAGAGHTKRGCMLLSGGIPTEGEGLEFPLWTGGVSSVFWPGAWGSSVAGTDRSEPVVPASRPDTCRVYS